LAEGEKMGMAQRIGLENVYGQAEGLAVSAISKGVELSHRGRGGLQDIAHLHALYLALSKNEPQKH
jgi:hypothetical protein